MRNGTQNQILIAILIPDLIHELDFNGPDDIPPFVLTPKIN